MSKWQKLLRLQEWDISIRYGTEKECRNDTICGFVTWEAQYRTAEIVINPSREDIEGTVIHELLHLRIEGDKEQDGVLDCAREFALNTLTELLLCAKRKSINSPASAESSSTK